MKADVIKSYISDGKLIVILRLETDIFGLESSLSDVERQVLDLIISSQGITQKQVSDILGPVRASRVIHTLEKKGFIKRERRGKTYVLMLR